MKINRIGITILSIIILITFSACKKEKEKEGKSGKLEKSGRAQNIEPLLKFSKTPKFETTEEAIKLRYKLKKNQKINAVHFLKMSMRYNTNLSVIDTKIYGNYEVKDILPDGKYSLNWVITRVITTLKVKDQQYNYDSNLKENTLPNADMLKGLIGMSIKANVDQIGSFSDVDLKSVLTLLGDDASSQKLKKEITQKAEQFMNISFILLPEKDVKIGDVYSGRSGTQDSSILDMVSKREYSIKEVSKDKKFVVLTPKIDFNMKSSIPNQKITIEKNKINGWVLFDVEKGLVKESNMHTRMSMKINDVKMKMDMKSNFKIIE